MIPQNFRPHGYLIQITLSDVVQEGRNGLDNNPKTTRRCQQRSISRIAALTTTDKQLLTIIATWLVVFVVVKHMGYSVTIFFLLFSHFPFGYINTMCVFQSLLILIFCNDVTYVLNLTLKLSFRGQNYVIKTSIILVVCYLK